MKKWVTRWKYVMAAKPVRTGIYRLKDGGYFLRARVVDKTGKLRPIVEVVHDVKSPSEAQRRRDALIGEARAAARGETRTRQPWSEFAASLLEERVARGDIESAATVEWWQDSLEHYLVPAFGHRLATDVTRARIDTWLTDTVLPWMTRGKLIQRMRNGEPFGKPRLVKLSASFVNGLLRIVRNISNAIKVKFDLPKSAFEGIEFLPEGRTYTREQPNALPPDVVPRFLKIARERYPQHYLMILMGFVTGARPGELRAIRCKGSVCDLDLDKGTVEIRRSHSRKQVVMDRTKTKTDRTITLPPALLDEVRRHIAAIPEGLAKKSDLLFPTASGKLRSRNVLTKPFKAIVAKLALPMRITPRAMRRTFNDLAREVGLSNVLTRSISGHETDAMQIHYSTARGSEQREGLAKVVEIITGEEKNQT